MPASLVLVSASRCIVCDIITTGRPGDSDSVAFVAMATDAMPGDPGARQCDCGTVHYSAAWRDI